MARWSCFMISVTEIIMVEGGGENGQSHGADMLAVLKSCATLL